MRYSVIIDPVEVENLQDGVSDAAKRTLVELLHSLQDDPSLRCRRPPCPPYAPDGKFANRPIPGERGCSWEVFFETDDQRRQVGVTQIVYVSARGYRRSSLREPQSRVVDDATTIELPAPE